MAVDQARELVAADRTGGRGLVGFLLRRFLGDGPFEVAGLMRDFFFDVTQRLVAGVDTPVKTGEEAGLPVLHRLAERLVTAVGRNR